MSIQGKNRLKMKGQGLTWLLGSSLLFLVGSPSWWCIQAFLARDALPGLVPLESWGDSGPPQAPLSILPSRTCAFPRPGGSAVMAMGWTLEASRLWSMLHMLTSSPQQSQQGSLLPFSPLVDGHHCRTRASDCLQLWGASQVWGASQARLGRVTTAGHPPGYHRLAPPSPGVCLAYVCTLCACVPMGVTFMCLPWGTQARFWVDIPTGQHKYINKMSWYKSHSKLIFLSLYVLEVSDIQPYMIHVICIYTQVLDIGCVSSNVVYNNISHISHILTYIFMCTR